MSNDNKDHKKHLDLSISKIKKKVDNDEVKQNQLYKYNIIPNHPSRSFFVGRTGSGKTNLMLSLLIDKKFYGDGYFNKVYIFSPTFNDDNTYMELIKRFDKYSTKTFSYSVSEEIDIDMIEMIINRQKEDIEEMGKKYSDRVLLLFDDCINDKMIKNKIMKDLYYKGRHFNISVWITSQSYMNLPRDYRLQLSNLFVFKPDASEIDRISKEQNNSVVDSKQLIHIIKQACQDKFSFLNINKQVDENNEWYRKNLDKIFEL